MVKKAPIAVSWGDGETQELKEREIVLSYASLQMGFVLSITPWDFRFAYLQQSQWNNFANISRTLLKLKETSLSISNMICLFLKFLPYFLLH